MILFDLSTECRMTPSRRRNENRFQSLDLGESIFMASLKSSRMKGHFGFAWINGSALLVQLCVRVWVIESPVRESRRKSIKGSEYVDTLRPVASETLTRRSRRNKACARAVSVGARFREKAGN